jgi:hypothetical protein
MNDREKKSDLVVENDDDTLKPKDEPPAKVVIGERFVPSYMNFDDWGVHRHDDFF